MSINTLTRSERAANQSRFGSDVIPPNGGAAFVYLEAVCNLTLLRRLVKAFIVEEFAGVAHCFRDTT